MYKYKTLEDINRKLKRIANAQIELKFARLEKHTARFFIQLMQNLKMFGWVQQQQHDTD